MTTSDKLDSGIYKPVTIQYTFVGGAVEAQATYSRMNRVITDLVRAHRRIQRKRRMAAASKAMTLAQLSIDIEEMRKLRDTLAEHASLASGYSVGASK